MAEVDTITVLDSNGVEREVPTLLSVEAILTTIDGRVDGLETLITSTNTKLDTAITALQVIDNMVLAAGSARIGTVGLHDGTNAIAFTDAAVSASAFALPVIQHPDGQNANGRASAANSTPVVLSNEDKTALADDAAFTAGTSPVNVAGFVADEASTDSVDEGDAGAARMTLDRKLIMTLQPHTAGGLSVFRSLDLDESEEEVKATAGCLYKLRLTNRTTSARYVKLYNATAANVTVGTTTPIDTIVVPGGTSADLCTVLTESFGGVGLTFDTALCLAATTALADNDTGAPGANDVVATAYYK